MLFDVDGTLYSQPPRRLLMAAELAAASLASPRETIRAAREIVGQTYLYTNNHFSAKAVANAAMIKAQLGEPITGDYPAAFVERYPEVRALVQVSARTAQQVPVTRRLI